MLLPEGRELVLDLVHTIQGHTPYFRAHWDECYTQYGLYETDCKEHYQNSAATLQGGHVSACAYKIKILSVSLKI